MAGTENRGLAGPFDAAGDLHLIKLAVGCPTPEALVARQVERRAREGALFHWTRMMPRRREALLAGGSIYWVIRGQVRLRQRLLGLESLEAEGSGRRRTRLELDADLVPTEARAWRVFQGWRYLSAAEAPPDLGARPPGGLEDMPEAMWRDLRSLGLL